MLVQTNERACACVEKPGGCSLTCSQPASDYEVSRCTPARMYDCMCILLQEGDPAVFLHWWQAGDTGANLMKHLPGCCVCFCVWCGVGMRVCVCLISSGILAPVLVRVHTAVCVCSDR